MNLLHVKTNAVPDFTGTVTVYNQTGGSQTIAATDLVRPSDWNSNHKMFLTFEGNTTNSSTLSGTNIPIAGMGAITVGASNGSFVISGNPNWLTTAQPPGAYLTTAAQSNHSHGNPTLALTNLSGTTASASNGFTLSLSAGVGGAGDGYNSAQFTNSTADSTMPLLWAGNSNGSGNITLGLTGSTITGSAPSGGANVAASALNGSFQFTTLNFHNGGLGVAQQVQFSTSTNGIYAQVYGQINISAGTQNNAAASWQFQDANGISFGENGAVITASHNGLTTAAQSNHSHNLATTTTNGSLIVVATTNSAGATIAIPPYLTTAQAPGAYLTTARASNDAIGLNTALTANGVSWTVNSSGLSLNVPAFLTTAAQSNHSHGNPTLALTNLTGTTASNSAGFTLSLSGAGGGVINQTGPNIAAGTQTGTSGTIVFANSNNVTFGMSDSSQVTASFNPINIGVSTNGNTAGTTGTVDGAGAQFIFHGGNNITLSQSINGSSVSLSIVGGGGGGGVTLDRGWDPFGYGAESLFNAFNNSSVYLWPVAVPAYISFNNLAFPWLFSGATNSTGQYTLSEYLGLYTYANSTQLSLYTSFLLTTALTHSGTQNSASNVGGVRVITLGLGNTSITPGNYVVANMARSSSSSANATFSYMVISQINTGLSGIGFMSPRSASNHLQPFQGRVTFNTSALPNSIAKSDVEGTVASVHYRPRVFSFGRSD